MGDVLAVACAWVWLGLLAGQRGHSRRSIAVANLHRAWQHAVVAVCAAGVAAAAGGNMVLSEVVAPTRHVAAAA